MINEWCILHDRKPAKINETEKQWMKICAKIKKKMIKIDCTFGQFITMQCDVAF